MTLLAVLALACVTRMPVTYQFRADLDRRRVAALVGGGVPGLALGVAVLS